MNSGIARFIYAIIAVGAVALLFTNDLKLFSAEKKQTAWGHVIQANGYAMGKSLGDSDFTNLSPHSPLSHDHLVKTGPNGETKIEYGEKFKLHPNSLVHLTKKARQFYVELKYGKLTRSEPKQNTLFLYNGKISQELNIKSLSKSKLPIQQQAQLFETDGIKLVETSDPQFQQTLQKTIKLHKRFLEKCFIKLYESRNGKTQGGKLSIQFKVTKLGKIEEPKVKESQFNDENFHSCIEEVISRVRFKLYKGPQREVILPLNIASPG